jgi:hypothetical protein
MRRRLSLKPLSVKALAADYGDLPRRTYICKIVLIKRHHGIYLDIQISKHQPDNSKTTLQRSKARD